MKLFNSCALLGMIASATASASVETVLNKYWNADSLTIMGGDVSLTSLPKHYSASDKLALVQLAMLPFPEFYAVAHEPARMFLEEIAPAAGFSVSEIEEAHVIFEAARIYGSLITATRNQIALDNIQA